MIDFAKELNPEQCAAATAGDGPMLVLAAAGTGKTRTLVHRVAYLVERGIPADRLMLLTFTNRAAREMLDRAEALVPSVTGIWSGTFHHVCARFLRRWGHLLGYQPGFTILDEEDQKKLMAQCIKDLADAHEIGNPKDFTKKEVILKLVSDAANRAVDFEQLVASRQTKEAIDAEGVVKAAKRYAAEKRRIDAMDFDDLLVNGLALVKEHAEVRERLQEQFLHVLVDEYQDTNAVQAEFTDVIAAGHRNVMAVGDDFQCIYTWRGAQFENIMQFPERWPGCRILKLERNYRSLAPILNVANVVMKDVPHRFEKTLRPARQATSPALPRLYRTWDARAQSDVVLKIILALRAQGVRYDDIAVLYRSHYTSIDIQMTLTRAHVPFKITSGIGVFEQLHVKDVLAFLRLAVDPKAELSFLRLVELFPGVGETTARKWWAKLGGVFDCSSPMDRMNLDSYVPAKAKDAWAGVCKAFEQAQTHFAAGEDRKLVEDFVRFFYGDHLRRQFEEDEATTRLEDLGELTTQIATAEGGLRGFLDEVALLTNLDANGRADVPEDHMHLTTIHQAKGMEWPVVILPWLSEGIFPSARSVEDGNVDEERRLFYVAVTRAKDRLYMCAPRVRKTADGGIYPCEPSLFVKELPDTLYDERDVSAPPLAPVGGGYGRGDVYAGYGNRYGASSGGRYGGSSSGGRYGGSSSGGWKTTWRR